MAEDSSSLSSRYVCLILFIAFSVGTHGFECFSNVPGVSAATDNSEWEFQKYGH